MGGYYLTKERILNISDDLANTGMNLCIICSSNNRHWTQDGYVEEYTGREYGLTGADIERPKKLGQFYEVMTRAIQMLWYPVGGEDFLTLVVKKDTEFLDLTLGLMFYYKPIL